MGAPLNRVNELSGHKDKNNKIMMPLWLFPLNFRGIGSGSYHKDDYNVRAAPFL